MCNAARASRPRVAVGILRILCNGMCTAQRFHMYGEEQRCRAGCRDEPDSLSHNNECPFLYNFVTVAWRNAAVLPRGGHLFHDLITQIFLRSLQHGIVGMGVIDTLSTPTTITAVIWKIQGTSEIAWKGEFRLLTAITPTYAHAYQSICLAGRAFLLFSIRSFACFAAKARYPNLPSSRTTTREKGNDFHGWAIYKDGGTRVSNGETIAGWGAVARSLHGLAQSTQLKHISRTKGPDSTPTTLLNSRVSLSRFHWPVCP